MAGFGYCSAIKKTLSIAASDALAATGWTKVDAMTDEDLARQIAGLGSRVVSRQHGRGMELIGGGDEIRTHGTPLQCTTV